MNKIQQKKMNKIQLGNGVSPSPESKTKEKKMKKIQLGFVGLFVALMLVLAPFNSTLAKTYEPENPEYEFHLVMQSSPGPFWFTLEKGALDAGKRYNVKVVFHMFPKESHEDQANRIDEVLALNPDGLVIAISNKALIEGPAMRAINRGIPVIAANAKDFSPEGEKIPYLFYVGENSRLAGQVVAKELLKARPGIKHVLVANQMPGLSMLEARVAGVKDILEPRGVKVTVIAINQNPTENLEKYRAHWTRHPETDGFVTTSSYYLYNEVARDFFKEEGLIDKVSNITFDMGEDVMEAVKKGEMLGMTDQQQWLEGYLTIHWLYLYKKWGFVPANDIFTGPYYINKDNVDAVEAAIKEGMRN